MLNGVSNFFSVNFFCFFFCKRKRRTKQNEEKAEKRKEAKKKLKNRYFNFQLLRRNVTGNKLRSVGGEKRPANDNAFKRQCKKKYSTRLKKQKQKI